MIWNKPFFTKKVFVILALTGLSLCSSRCSTFFLSPTKRDIKEHLAQAERFSERMAYVQAIETYERILENYPENPWEDEVLFNIGCLYLYYTNPEQEFEKAKIYLERIIEEYPESSYLKATLALLAVLNTLVLKENEISKITQEIALKEKEVDNLRQSLKSLQKKHFTMFVSTAYELSLREREMEELNKKILNQKNIIDNLQTQIKKIKEVDIQHEKKKSDEQE